jgi:hypothetical protein
VNGAPQHNVHGKKWHHIVVERISKRESLVTFFFYK